MLSVPGPGLCKIEWEDRGRNISSCSWGLLLKQGVIYTEPDLFLKQFKINACV